MLEIKNLTVKVKNDTPILTDVSLSIDEGTCIGLTGASGSGKTTLIKSIMGMNSGDLEIAQGQILLDGDNLLIHGAKEREPTSALDEANRDLLLELLRKYQKTAAILFISHDTEAMKALCPITHVMERGKIIETQATEQLFIHPQQPWTKRFAEAACHREEVNWKWTALN